MREEIAAFGDPALAGVLARPDSAGSRGRTGIVLLSPGLLHRIGPHRVYVQLARALASDGFPVLRFDFSGQGDSPPRTDHLPIKQSVVAETTAAIDYILTEAGCSEVVLIGHCSGALIALLTTFSDTRVASVVAISPEGGDEAWVEFDRRRKEARYFANYYRRSSVGNKGRWKRFLTGRVNYRSVARNVARNIIWYRLSALTYRYRSGREDVDAPAAEREDVREFKEGLRSLAERQIPILLIHPDQSYGPELLRALLGDTIEEMHQRDELNLVTISSSDHMFTPLAAQDELVSTICEWTREHVPSTSSLGDIAEVAG